IIIQDETTVRHDPIFKAYFINGKFPNHYTEENLLNPNFFSDELNVVALLEHFYKYQAQLSLEFTETPVLNVEPEPVITEQTTAIVSAGLTENKIFEENEGTDPNEEYILP